MRTSYLNESIRDALCDLPEIKTGASKDRLRYDKNPQSHFQRKMRTNRATGGTMTVLQVCLLTIVFTFY